MSVKITVDEAWKKIKEGALVVDVRTPAEFNAGHLENALNIPHTEIVKHISEFGSDKNREVVLYCKSGGRVVAAQAELRAQGFSNVFNAGGYEDLSSARNYSEPNTNK